MSNRKPIIASVGKILTNGTIYGKTIYLADGVNASTFHEITIEEYEKKLEEQRKIKTNNNILFKDGD